MIKISIFNKTNDVLIVDAFKNVFKRRSREVSLREMLAYRISHNGVSPQTDKRPSDINKMWFDAN